MQAYTWKFINIFIILLRNSEMNEAKLQSLF